MLNAEPSNIILTMVGGKPMYGSKDTLEKMVQQVYPAPGRSNGAFTFDPSRIKAYVDGHVDGPVAPLISAPERVPPLGLQKPTPKPAAAAPAALGNID
jgi:hypothetical protein